MDDRFRSEVQTGSDMTRAVIVFLLLTVTLWGCLARGRQLQNIEQLLKDLTHSVGALSNSCGETALWNLLIFLGIVLVQTAFRLVLFSRSRVSWVQKIKPLSADDPELPTISTFRPGVDENTAYTCFPYRHEFCSSNFCLCRSFHFELPNTL